MTPLIKAAGAVRASHVEPTYRVEGRKAPVPVECIVEFISNDRMLVGGLAHIVSAARKVHGSCRPAARTLKQDTANGIVLCVHINKHGS